MKSLLISVFIVSWLLLGSCKEDRLGPSSRVGQQDGEKTCAFTIVDFENMQQCHFEISDSDFERITSILRMDKEPSSTNSLSPNCRFLVELSSDDIERSCWVYIGDSGEFYLELSDDKIFQLRKTFKDLIEPLPPSEFMEVSHASLKVEVVG